MSMSDIEIFKCLHELGLDPPPINDRNRGYALALIYNNKIDENIDDKETEEYEHTTNEHDFIYKEQRRNIYLIIFLL